MKVYEVAWVDKVERSVEIGANSEGEAINKWKNGEYNTDNICENDCETISEEHEIEVSET